MIFIKSIEVDEIDGNYVEITHMLKNRGADLYKMGEVPISPNITYIQELIEGKRFFNARGEEVVIGFSQSVEEAIGLPMEAFKNLNEDYIEALDRFILYKAKCEELERDNYGLSKTIKCFTQKTWLERFKYLIFGYRHKEY